MKRKALRSSGEESGAKGTAGGKQPRSMQGRNEAAPFQDVSKRGRFRFSTEVDGGAADAAELDELGVGGGGAATGPAETDAGTGAPASDASSRSMRSESDERRA